MRKGNCFDNDCHNYSIITFIYKNNHPSFMSRFDILKSEIDSILPKSPFKIELKHSEMVLKWVLKLKPNADEALKISAIAHDIDRAITGITEKDLKDYSKIDSFKKEHAIRSAKFTCDIMQKHKYRQEIIEKVKHLIENHEEGGDDETNILTNADSIAYFEYNIPSYMERNGRERTKEKIKFMYKRLSEPGKLMIHQLHFDDKSVEKLFLEAISEI
jgi:hypothetical protein